MTKIELTISSAEAMTQLGQKLAPVLQPGDRLLLSGVLGAGKTTLVQGIARGLGYEGRVTSPTFTLMNIYPAICPVYHIDFYRLDSMEGDEDWEEHFYGDGVTLIEWPEQGYQNEDDIVVEISLTDNDYDLPRKVVIYVPVSRGKLIERLGLTC